VTKTTLTLTAAPAPGAYVAASISKLLDTLRRVDGTSWLDSGFIEGQLVRIAGIGADRLMKVDLITGERTLSREAMPADPSGLINVGPIFVTPDGTTTVYSYTRLLSDLYVVESPSPR